MVSVLSLIVTYRGRRGGVTISGIMLMGIEMI